MTLIKTLAMKKEILLGFCLFLSCSLLAQYELPPEVVNAIPQKYTITSQAYVDGGVLVKANISLEIPNKYACSDNNIEQCSINIEVISREGDKNSVAYLEKMSPFKSTLPNASNYKPSKNPYDDSEKFSDSNDVDVEGGRAAYYVQTIFCMMTQYDEYEMVFLKSLQGNWSKSFKTEISGAIPAEEAILIVNELYEILYGKF